MRLSASPWPSEADERVTIPYTRSLFAPRPDRPTEAIIRPFLQRAPVDLAGMVAALGMRLKPEARLSRGT
jgi:hypothetical protein